MAENYQPNVMPGDPNFVGPVGLPPGAKPVEGAEPRTDGKHVYSVPAGYTGPLNSPNAIFVRESAPPPPPPGAGQGFRFDVEGIDQIIKAIDDVIDEQLDKARRKAQVLVRVDSPGDEIVSDTVAATANRSGESYNEYLKSTISYLKHYRQALVDVRDGNVRREDDQKAAFKG